MLRGRFWHLGAPCFITESTNFSVFKRNDATLTSSDYSFVYADRLAEFGRCVFGVVGLAD